MPSVLARIRHWWQGARSTSTTLPAYSIPCVCGQVVSGRRQHAAQVVRCPACRAAVFVLPASPLPSPDRAAEPAPPATVRTVPGRFVLVLASALIIVAATLWAISSLLAPGPVPDARGQTLTATQAEQRADSLLKAAADQIAQGHFGLALEHLDAVVELQEQASGQWTAPAFVAHQRQEIALYADLLDEALEELLAEAIDLPEKEWLRQFKKRYQGKAFLFDATVMRLASSAFVFDYQIQAAGQKAQLHLADLPFFKDLPAGQPVRVLFGARLAKIERIAPGSWLIRLAPDSLVLLTDPQALAISCPVLADVETRLVLARQKDLVKQR